MKGRRVIATIMRDNDDTRRPWRAVLTTDAEEWEFFEPTQESLLRIVARFLEQLEPTKTK